MLIILSSLNTCFDRNDIPKCINVKYVSITWIGVTSLRSFLQYIYIYYWK